MLTMTVGQFPVEAVLVEEKVAISREFFLSIAINNTARKPTMEAGFGKLEVTVVSREKESPHFQTVFATGSK